MAKLLDEVKYDMSFMKSHTLQPQWFKVAKVFILLGFLVGYTCLFGLIKMALFFAVFVVLSLLVHLINSKKVLSTFGATFEPTGRRKMDKTYFGLISLSCQNERMEAKLA